MSVPGQVTDVHNPEPSTGSWQRLSSRVIWVDLVQSVLSLLPAVFAWRLGADSGTGPAWPLVGIAVFGVVGAVFDAVRWGFTRYHVTASHVEVKSGVFLRVHRSIQRDRIRSVDIEARLRHRLAGLRVLEIGAGQQNAEGESALALDALSTGDARALQSHLLHGVDLSGGPGSYAGEGDEATLHDESAVIDRNDQTVVLAGFQPRWVVYNMMSIWAYILAVGLGWGTLWLAGGFGIDLASLVTELLDWEAVGWAGTAAIAFAAITVVGAIGLAATYFLEYWGFELARVPSPDGTMLRTRQGLLTTREVNRDESRIRGVRIAEPLWWRWMSAAETSVITTGLSMWSLSQPATILPRVPVAVATRTAMCVLGTSDPFDAQLTAHPPAALRRRLWWATASTIVVGAVLVWLAAVGVLPYAAAWVTLAVWPVTLVAAVIAYRALGHAIVGPHLVTRSGLTSRATTVLERSAVSTIVVRESLLQRRLGLRSVSTMTAAGYGVYDTPDIAAHESVAFALQAAPGILEQFLTTHPEDKPLAANARHVE